MKARILRKYLARLYSKIKDIKDDKDFMEKSGFYEYDAELGMVPVILKEDPEYIKERKRNIIKKRVKSFCKKIQTVFGKVDLNEFQDNLV